MSNRNHGSNKKVTEKFNSGFVTPEFSRTKTLAHQEIKKSPALNLSFHLASYHYRKMFYAMSVANKTSLKTKSKYFV